MPRPTAPSPKRHRKNTAVPGILRETIENRWAEFGYPGFSPFALELICFDLRKRREHFLTRAFADDTLSVQEAVDRELVRQYVPGHERRGLLMQAVFCDVAETGRERPRGSFAVSRNYIYFSELLAPCIEIRWRELGYTGFSAYVTALIRYDLMLLGPHKYFTAKDSDPELLARLDEETVRIFQEAIPQPLYIDVLISQFAGREVPPEERPAFMRQIAAIMRERALQEGNRLASV